MGRTVLKGRNGQEVHIVPGGPTVLIGERLNPGGGARKKLTQALLERNAAFLQAEALAQVEAGADVLDINVQAPDLTDEAETLAWAVQAVASVVDVPLSLDSNNPAALRAALEVAPGRPIINSVTGEEQSLQQILPLVAECGIAVIGLTIGDDGIPQRAEERLDVARRLLQRAGDYGIPPEDVVIDTLTLTVGADHTAARTALRAMRLVHEELGVSLTAGCSNVSFGLPRRQLVNEVYLAMAIAMGLNSAIVDPARVRSVALAADLLAGRDEYAMRFLEDYRRRHRAEME